eukprot:SAG31_NODE_6510_length_1991_cov_2.016385_1_plen_152_part_00
MQGEAEPTDCDPDGDVEPGGVAELCGNGHPDCGNRNAGLYISHIRSDIRLIYFSHIRPDIRLQNLVGDDSLLIGCMLQQFMLYLTSIEIRHQLSRIQPLRYRNLRVYSHNLSPSSVASWIQHQPEASARHQMQTLQSWAKKERANVQMVVH